MTLMVEPFPVREISVKWTMNQPLLDIVSTHLEASVVTCGVLITVLHLLVPFGIGSSKNHMRINEVIFSCRFLS